MSVPEVGHDEEVLAALRKVAADARPADPRDEVCGVPATYVAAPESTDETAQVLRACAEHGLAVVARGSGTKLRWGAAPRRVDVVVDTSRMAGVVEHEAGDLVVTALAGTTLDALQDALAPAGQRLAVDPVRLAGDDGAGTVGGLIATGVSGPLRLLQGDVHDLPTGATGPLRLAAGTVRDLLIGVTVVRADGVVAKAGGKVVKNVAGYDLAKLMCGSWGTLALVTQATFRLHPLPQSARWVVAPVDSAAQALALAQQVLHSQLVPSGLEVDRPESRRGSVAVLVEGTVEGARARAESARALLGDDAVVADEPPEWWGQAPWQPGGVVLRLTTEMAGLGALLDGVDAATTGIGAPAAVRGSAGVGVLHAALPPDVDADLAAAAVTALRGLAPRWGGDVVVLDAPPAVRERVDMWGPAPGLELMRRVKDQFDPEHRLAPGRFVGGI